MAELFDFCRQNRTVEAIDVDPMTGSTTIQKQQNVEPILDALHDIRQNLDPNKGMRHIGSIPLTIAGQWARECGASIGTKEFAEYAKSKLQDSDWAKLRAHM